MKIRKNNNGKNKPGNATLSGPTNLASESPIASGVPAPTTTPKKNGFVLGTDLFTLQNQLKRTLRNLANAAPGHKKGWNKRAEKIQAAIADLQRQKAADETQANLEAYTKTFSDMFAPTLGQTYQDWMANKQGEYDYANQRLQQELNRRLNAQGLLGSGRETQLVGDAVSGLNAEYGKMFEDQKQKDIDNATAWIESQQGATQAEKNSLRGTLTNILGIAASQSPMNAGVSAAGDAGSTTYNSGNTAANLAGSNYPYNTYVPQPTKNDNASTNISIQGILGSNQANNGIWTGVLNSLFGNSGQKTSLF